MPSYPCIQTALLYPQARVDTTQYDSPKITPYYFSHTAKSDGTENDTAFDPLSTSELSLSSLFHTDTHNIFIRQKKTGPKLNHPVPPTTRDTKRYSDAIPTRRSRNSELAIQNESDSPSLLLTLDTPP